MRVLNVAVPFVLVLAACGGGRAPAAEAPAPAGAQAQVPQLYIPDRVGEFRFIGREDFDDPNDGSMFRFEHADSLVADVFLYPGPDFGADCPLDCASDLLRREHEGFVAGFDVMKSRGYVDDIRVLSGGALTPPAGAAWRIGHRLHLSVTRKGQQQHSDQWIVYLPGTRLKVRSTFVESPARVARLETFLDGVVTAFLTEPPPKVRNERPLPAVATADSIFALAQGLWDWEGSEKECEAGQQEITVTPDRTMLLLVTRPMEAGESPDTTRYRVIEAGPQILPWAPFAIRLDMEGEDRRTDDGKLVVWDLVLKSRDRFHWHRTDWPPNGLTEAMIRCDAPGRTKAP